MKIFEKYALRKLQKDASMVARRVVLPDPDNIRKVCILWQPVQEQAYKYLYDYFQRSKVIFRNLCVYPKDAALPSGASSITARDLDWLGFPKSGIAGDFLNTEYDLLLNIAPEQSMALLFLTALSRAHFKIGCASAGPNYFDLNIRLSKEKDALYLAMQQIYYLEQLNKKTSV